MNSPQPPQEPDLGKQKREHVRVEDILPLFWRRITPEEYQRVVEHFRKFRAFPKGGDDQSRVLQSLDIGDRLQLLEKSDRNLAALLGMMDMKLNWLVRLFGTDETQQPLVPTPVNISGGGLAFWRKLPRLAKGDLLEMRIALNREGLMAVHCFARVVLVREGDRGEMAKVACHYEPIPDPEREKIIQFVFKRQSELLREQKG